MSMADKHTQFAGLGATDQRQVVSPRSEQSDGVFPRVSACDVPEQAFDPRGHPGVQIVPQSVRPAWLDVVI